MKGSVNSKLLTPKEAARRLRISTDTLASWRCRQTYALSFVKIGARVFYRAEDLQKFIEARMVRISGQKKASKHHPKERL